MCAACWEYVEYIGLVVKALRCIFQLSARKYAQAEGVSVLALVYLFDKAIIGNNRSAGDGVCAIGDTAAQGEVQRVIFIMAAVDAVVEQCRAGCAVIQRDKAL